MPSGAPRQDQRKPKTIYLTPSGKARKENQNLVSHAKAQRTQRKASQTGVSRPLADASRFLFWNQAIQKRKQVLNAVRCELRGLA